MKKLIKRSMICFLIAAFIWCWNLIRDRRRLHQELIRLHVVAASDSREDQELKLRVRDAVTESLTEAMKDIADIDQAKIYLRENLQKIQNLANEVLREAGCEDRAIVTLSEETFDTRFYDTFTLPAGVYEALRITIGNGEGHNWWCVIFPSLCMSATSEGFEDIAAGAGFSDPLIGALEGEEGYELRFYLLDKLGQLENLLFVG